MEQREEIKKFVADARWLAEVYGEPGAKHVVDASVQGDLRRYEDERVVIECAVNDRAMTVYALPHPEGSKYQNPVICVSEEGEMYRYHGEAGYLFDHLRQLVSQ